MHMKPRRVAAPPPPQSSPRPARKSRLPRPARAAPTRRSPPRALHSCFDNHAVLAVPDGTDDHGMLAGLLQHPHRLGGIVTGHQHDHADTAVESAMHLAVVDRAGACEPVEDRLLRPAATLQYHLQAGT